MGRHLFRALVANGFVRLPEKVPTAKQAPRRRMLLERLEDRLLFDTGPVAPADVDVGRVQQAQETMPPENSIAEPAELRWIAPLENVADVVADLTNSTTNRAPELIPDADSSGPANVDGVTTAARTSDPHAALLDSNKLAQQMLTTADERRSEVQAATADVRDELLAVDPVLNGEALTRLEIAFVDTSLTGHKQLVNDLLAQRDPSREFQVVFIDARENGLVKITETLRAANDIDAIHVFSHGDSRGFKLGSQWVTSDLLAGYSAELSAWGDALLDGADILIYGCGLASEAAGRELLQSLAALTGANVAASDDLTGSASSTTGGPSHMTPLTMQVSNSLAASITDLTIPVNVTHSNVEPTPANNSKADTDTLNAQPDYLITIDDGETLVRPGDLLSYTVAVSNRGNQDGTGVVVTVEFPTTLLQDVVASNGGVVDTIFGIITWAVGDLNAGDHGSMTFTAKVRQVLDPNTPSITVTATVTDDGGNGAVPSPANNAGSNWLMTFPNILFDKHSHRMEILVTPAISNVAHENGFNLRRDCHPAIYTELFLNESCNVAGVFCD